MLKKYPGSAGGTNDVVNKPHNMTRRNFAGSALALLSSVSLASKAAAATYPSRTVRIIIPFSAGGGADVLLRIVANALSERWKQSVVVENRAGGNTVIGTVAAVQSAPDGYTLLFAGDQSITINPALSTVPYSVEKDLVPITQVANNPMLLVASGRITWVLNRLLTRFTKEALLCRC